MFATRLRELRKSKGYTLEELATLYNKKFSTLGTGLNKGTLSKYENNQQTPMLNTISCLAEVLEVSTDYLLGKSNTQAPPQSTQANTPAQETKERLLTKIPLYHVPVSAGTGQWLNEGNEYDFIEIENVPKGADFGLRVRGDSMAPMYLDDDIVFVKANVITESGQVGVFYLNGEGYLKMLQGNRLVSLNGKYKPIVIGEYDSFFCVGRVIGKTHK